jgi:hypothetical protein
MIVHELLEKYQRRECMHTKDSACHLLSVSSRVISAEI